MIIIILIIDVLAFGLIIFSLGTTLTRRIGRTIRFARFGGFTTGVLTYTVYSMSLDHKPNFHMPPDWFCALFLSGPSIVLGFVLGVIAGLVGDSCASSNGQSSRQIHQLCDATRHLWTAGLSVVSVGMALGMPAKFSNEEPVVARLAAHFGFALLWVGAGLALLSTGLAIWGCFRVGMPFRRVATIEVIIGLPLVATIAGWLYAF